jgi:hypothetical protein
MWRPDDKPYKITAVEFRDFAIEDSKTDFVQCRVNALLVDDGNVSL